MDDEDYVASGPHAQVMQSLLSKSESNDESDRGDPGLAPSDTCDGTNLEEPQLPLFMQLPEQDIDKQGTSASTKLTDDLSEIKEKMHELTFHFFNDKAYAVKNPDAVFFGHEEKGVSRKSDYNLSRYLDKSLSLGQYSHGNPIISRVGLYLEPIIGSALSFLCVFRALFNVYTWRDPFLSFWVSIFASLLVMILFVFPWRIFLFIAGVIVVGPQVRRAKVACALFE